jgi:hypothetical protein
MRGVHHGCRHARYGPRARYRSVAPIRPGVAVVDNVVPEPPSCLLAQRVPRPNSDPAPGGPGRVVDGGKGGLRRALTRRLRTVPGRAREHSPDEAISMPRCQQPGQP